MPKYRKKAVVIEAYQWTGDNGSEIEKFTDYHVVPSKHLVEGNKLTILTLEGPITASVGDYIIKGIQGEFYPCKPDIFDLTYEEVIEE